MAHRRIVASLPVSRHRQIPVIQRSWLTIRPIQVMTGHPVIADDPSMLSPRDRARTLGPGSSWPEALLLDDLLDAYVEWRESARGVADAYVQWSFAFGPERGLRFAAYTAALDREQKTAAAYAESVTDLERWLQRAETHRRS